MSNTTLIPIHTAQEFSGHKESVNARELHQFLEVGTRFNDWIERRIKEYSFVENVQSTLKGGHIMSKPLKSNKIFALDKSGGMCKAGGGANISFLAVPALHGGIFVPKFWASLWWESGSGNALAWLRTSVSSHHLGGLTNSVAVIFNTTLGVKHV